MDTTIPIRLEVPSADNPSFTTMDAPIPSEQMASDDEILPWPPVCSARRILVSWPPKLPPSVPIERMTPYPQLEPELGDEHPCSGLLNQSTSRAMDSCTPNLPAFLLSSTEKSWSRPEALYPYGGFRPRFDPFADEPPFPQNLSHNSDVYSDDASESSEDSNLNTLVDDMNYSEVESTVGSEFDYLDAHDVLDHSLSMHYLGGALLNAIHDSTSIKETPASLNPSDTSDEAWLDPLRSGFNEISPCARSQTGSVVSMVPFAKDGASEDLIPGPIDVDVGDPAREEEQRPATGDGEFELATGQRLRQGLLEEKASLSKARKAFPNEKSERAPITAHISETKQGDLSDSEYVEAPRASHRGHASDASDLGMRDTVESESLGSGSWASGGLSMRKVSVPSSQERRGSRSVFCVDDGMKRERTVSAEARRWINRLHLSNSVPITWAPVLVSAAAITALAGCWAIRRISRA